jgi:hypothetical protein
VDFNEIKHYFNTGEHLAKPSVVECKQYVIILRGRWNGERLGIVETRPHYTNYKGIHSFYQTKKLVT